MSAITSFQGEHRFLSNFWQTERPIHISGGLQFSHVEGAYQASKTLDPDKQREFLGLAPGKCKRLGRTIQMRADWDSVKVQVMLGLLRQKFYPGSYEAGRLALTGNALLVEGEHLG